LNKKLSIAQSIVGLLLTCTSGLAIVLYGLKKIPLSFTVSFVVFPTIIILVAIILYFKKKQRFQYFSELIIQGGKWGLIATLFYDAIRPFLQFIFRFDFNPYGAMPIFGYLMTGLEQTAPMAIFAGWMYHFWNGISFGMMFTMLVPKGGMIKGLIWAMLLQGLMMWVYPNFLQVRLDNTGFLMTGIVGHGLWGIVLGYGIKRYYAKNYNK
jgi:hypothetical protein